MTEIKLTRSAACPNCSATMRGRFCTECGEKMPDEKEMTLRFFFSRVWSAITFSDRKFLQSIYYLLLRPGFLTAEYFAGRRKRYAQPLALFFAINLLYFLYQPFDALNSSLQSQISGQFYSPWAAKVISDIQSISPLAQEELIRQYNQMSGQISKLFLMVLVLLFALGTSLVNNRRKPLFYFHLTTALHYVSFVILGFLILLPALLISLLGVWTYFSPENVPSIDVNAAYVSLPLLGLLGLYAYKMQQQLFPDRPWKNFLKSGVLALGFILSVFLYRLFLFVLTIFFLGYW